MARCECGHRVNQHDKEYGCLSDSIWSDCEQRCALTADEAYGQYEALAAAPATGGADVLRLH